VTGSAGSGNPRARGDRELAPAAAPEHSEAVPAVWTDREAMAHPAEHGRKSRGARPVADLVGPVILAACRRRGFAAAELVTLWPELVDPEIAGATQPERIDWPRRRGPEDDGEAATLVVACSGPAALLVSHQTEQILERLNAFLGWRAIGRLRIVQRPLRPAAKPGGRRIAPLGPAGERRLAAALGGVTAGPLAEALARLGRAALGGPAGAGAGPQIRPIPADAAAPQPAEPRSAPPRSPHRGDRS
jgi:hypothetical protein